MHDRTMEEASQSIDEMCLNTSYDMGCDATSLLPSKSHDDVGPSHRFARGDTSQSPSMVYDDSCPPTSSTTSPLPTTRTSPPPTTGTTPTDVEMRSVSCPFLGNPPLVLPPSPPPRVCAYRGHLDRNTQPSTRGFTH